MNLLFIDDDPIVLRLYQSAFGRSHHVSVADDGASALELIRERGDFDLVVCDVMMPNVSGIELFAQVREHAPALADAFVFATGGGAHPPVAAFLATVSNEVLEKPFDIAELRELVTRRARR